MAVGLTALAAASIHGAMPTAALKSVQIAGTLLDRYFHVCAFFDSRDQEYSVLESYYKEGLSNGEKALQLVDPNLHGEHKSRLAHMGLDVAACEACGQLEVVTRADTYLSGGAFEPAKMLVTVDAVIATARERGFPRTRIMGNMGWALDEARAASA